MKYKVIIPIIFIIIMTMFTNIVFADDENIDIVNIPGQTSVPVTAIPSEENDEMDLSKQKKVEQEEISREKTDVYKSNSEDTTKKKM